jgi:hypothetical protein
MIAADVDYLGIADHNLTTKRMAGLDPKYGSLKAGARDIMKRR